MNAEIMDEDDIPLTDLRASQQLHEGDPFKGHKNISGDESQEGAQDVRIATSENKTVKKVLRRPASHLPSYLRSKLLWMRWSFWEDARKAGCNLGDFEKHERATVPSRKGYRNVRGREGEEVRKKKKSPARKHLLKRPAGTMKRPASIMKVMKPH